jgi:hypothetical protein
MSATVIPGAATADITEFADQVREQVIATVKQGHEIALTAVQSWTKAVAALPVADLPEVPGLSELPDVKTIANYSFDLAIDLLNLQRDFAVQVGQAFVPSKAA